MCLLNIHNFLTSQFLHMKFQKPLCWQTFFALFILMSFSNSQIFAHTSGGPDLNLSTNSHSWAESITVRGQVTDDDDEPLSGATILEKGTTNGSIADVDGNFIIEVDDQATLVVSYVGFSSVEIAVGGRTNISIKLGSASSTLNEIIVTGYGRQTKRR